MKGSGDMKRLSLAIGLLLIGLSFAACQKSEPTIFVFTHVNVVPMSSEIVLEDYTVLVEGSQIIGVGPASEVEIPANSEIIDGDGRYLMPGLTDMHVHTREDWDDENIWPVSPLKLYLANGITTIRDMGPTGDDLTYALAWNDEIEGGTRIGPEIFTSGELVFQSPLEDPGGIVRQNFDRGYDFLKVYSYLSMDDFHQVLLVAEELGMYSTGHIPYAVGLENAIADGLDEVAHIEELMPEFVVYDKTADLNSREWLPYLVSLALQQFDLSTGFLEEEFETSNTETISMVINQLTQAEVPVCTTLVIDETIIEKVFDLDNFLSRPENQYFENGYLDSLLIGQEKHLLQFSGIEDLAIFKRDMDYWLLRELHQAGVMLLLGTDSGTGGMGILPGFSIHNELRILIQNGFTPYEALLTGTVNAAEVVSEMSGEANFGIIKVGFQADLLLLEGNPLDDVSVLRNPLGVMAAGRWYPAAVIAEWLAE